ncbi:MAG: HAMP domain-containing sensor histidine kinase [Phycisphaerales bacterium]|nr:HAMP domain-containing sensor histidine kinase [Phycisphaerales bacterium]
MNTRRAMTWVIFGASVVLALGALAWVSIEVVALEKRETLSTLNANRQESIRRSLWRMDSRMAPVLAIEASRPYSNYKALENNREQWLQQVASGRSLTTPSSNSGYSYANQYFEFDQDFEDTEVVGKISSALKSNRSQWDIEIPDSSTQARSDEMQISLSEEQGNVQEAELSADSDYEARKRVADLVSQTNIDSKDGLTAPNAFSNQSLEEDKKESTIPNDPKLNLQKFGDEEPSQSFEGKFEKIAESQSSDQIGTLIPRWISDDVGATQLVLVRSVIIDNQSVMQGVWLDWPKLRDDLLDSVEDVMPGATLSPVIGPRSSMVGGYQLATIPVEFIPPTNQLVATWRWSPATVGLLVTWIAILSTIIAVGIVLRAAIVLSDRRGKFVSAVTHELRTPLTTFRLYSQMLADGMVTDDNVKGEYLGILKRESERLTGIVENVLEYARLTRQRSSKDKAAGVQTLSPGALVARFRPAMARRAGQSNLDLVVSLDLDAHAHRSLTIDPQAVERIMMNLIENACKYAAPQEDEDSAIEDIDTRVHFDVSIKNNTLELLIADHGPGIPQSEGARIFGEFQRGRRGLSNARSGLGLGLALSRGLAREMDGDLILTRRRGHGAEFLLTIPLDEDQPSQQDAEKHSHA